MGLLRLVVGVGLVGRGAGLCEIGGDAAELRGASHQDDAGWKYERRADFNLETLRRAAWDEEDVRISDRVSRRSAESSTPFEIR